MAPEPATYPGYRFPAEIIGHAIRLHHLFGLSLRDVELILDARDVVVTHKSIRQRCLRFGADFARRVRPARSAGASASTTRSPSSPRSPPSGSGRDLPAP